MHCHFHLISVQEILTKQLHQILLTQLMMSTRMSSMMHCPTLEQRTSRSRLAQKSLKMILFILRLMERVLITEGVIVALLHPFHLWLERRKIPKLCRQQLVRSVVNYDRLLGRA